MKVQIQIGEDIHTLQVRERTHTMGQAATDDTFISFTKTADDGQTVVILSFPRERIVKIESEI